MPAASLVRRSRTVAHTSGPAAMNALRLGASKSWGSALRSPSRARAARSSTPSRRRAPTRGGRPVTAKTPYGRCSGPNPLIRVIVPSLASTRPARLLPRLHGAIVRAR